MYVIIVVVEYIYYQYLQTVHLGTEPARSKKKF